MTRIFLTIFCSCFVVCTLVAQSLYIPANARFTSSGNISMAIDNGGIINNGITNFDSASITFTGKNPVSTIGGTTILNLKKIIINKSTGDIELEQSMKIYNELLFKKGNLDLNGKNLTLEQNAFITGETETGSVIGPDGGEIQMSYPIIAATTVNPGNIGAMITSAYPLGTAKIIRGHKIQYSRSLGRSVMRYYNIIPAAGSVIRTTVRFYYLDKELNDLVENNLQLYNSSNAGVSWTRRGFTTKDASGNFVEMTNQRALNMFTLSTADIFKREMGTATIPEFSIKLTPNPVTDIGFLTISSPMEEKAELTIINSEGKLMLQKSFTCIEGSNQLSFSTNGFASGTYYASILCESGEKHQISFVKN